MEEDQLRIRLERVREGDLNEREKRIEENMGLVRHIVRRFLGRGYEAEDLFQIGCIGLMKAIDKFDLSFEVRFSTYAVPMIQGELRRFLRDDGMVKISRGIKEQSYQIHKAKEKLYGELGREPGIAELSKETGISTEDIVTALEACVPVESIYRAVGNQNTGKDGAEMYLVDQLADAKSREDATAGVLDHLLLQQLLNTLDGKQRQLIYLRYFDNQTQNEVAKRFGISQVQVSRMEKRILLKLRKECELDVI